MVKGTVPNGSVPFCYGVTKFIQGPRKKNCHYAPSGQVLLGIRQFNNGEWFECHETLELLWISETGDLRNLYQGIIQLAIALHHWRNGNFNGAICLLDGGMEYLSKLPQICLWIDVAELVRQAESVKKQLESLGTSRMADLDPGCIPKIVTASV